MTANTVPREKIPWFPTINTDLCDGCRICLEFCPHGVYGGDPNQMTVGVEQPYQCVVGCSNCRDLCPQKAIAFPDLEAIAGLISELRREPGGGS